MKSSSSVRQNGKAKPALSNGAQIPRLLLVADASKESEDIRALLDERVITYEIVQNGSIENRVFRELPTVVIPEERRAYQGERMIRSLFLARFAPRAT